MFRRLPDKGHTFSYLRRMPLNPKYEAVIGLEVHAQLLTESKLFCGDATTFGAAPNTQVSAISLAHPGTLPKMNKKAIELAVRLGVALNCDIVQNNYFARKNYFYPDLPKGYQISQHTTPICKNGYVTIEVDGIEKQVALNRIHLEEDAGKSIHDIDEHFTCIDLNRAGMPLLEIVTEPVMHSAEEAFAYITELRKIARYIGVCDGNMEEGSLRCDANISIRKAGDQRLGTRVEVKNLNSIRNVRRAIEFEIDRLIQLAERGEDIVQQTRSFDADNGITFNLREKEEANDYRYFPEPDLAPFHIPNDEIRQVKDNMPALPAELEKKYVKEFGLPVNEARLIAEERSTSEYFDALRESTGDHKSAANWLLGPVRTYLNENNIDLHNFSLSAGKLSEIIALVNSGKVNFNIAASRLLPAMATNPGDDPEVLARRLNIFLERDDETISAWIEEVLNKMPDKIAEYKKGKKNLLGLFAGEVKKISKGKADMRAVQSLLTEKLNQ